MLYYGLHVSFEDLEITNEAKILFGNLPHASHTTYHDGITITVRRGFSSPHLSEGLPWIA